MASFRLLPFVRPLDTSDPQSTPRVFEYGVVRSMQLEDGRWLTTSEVVGGAYDDLDVAMHCAQSLCVTICALSVHCATCRHFNPDLTGYGHARNADGTYAVDLGDDSDDIAHCEWPAEALPSSLKWGNRERGLVKPTDGAECSGWSPVSGLYVET